MGLISLLCLQYVSELLFFFNGIYLDMENVFCNPLNR